jgi:hypothetical protein
MKGLLGSHDIQSLVSVNETAVFVCERGVTHRFQQKKKKYIDVYPRWGFEKESQWRSSFRLLTTKLLKPRRDLSDGCNRSSFWCVLRVWLLEKKSFFAHSQVTTVFLLFDAR